MKTRYLNPDEFRAEASKTTKDHDGAIDVTMPDDERVIVVASLLPEISKADGDDADAPTILFRITDETVDRMSDTIATIGWDIKDYKKNPVVLWSHSHYNPPVARSLKIEVDKKLKEVRSIAEFTPKDLYPFGFMVYEMYVGKFLNAVSVGFQPKSYEWVSQDEDEDRAKRGGINFLKQSLLEYSACPVPANPNALALARSAGIDIGPMKAWAEQVLDETASTNKSPAVRQHLELMRSIAKNGATTLLLDLGSIPKETPSPSKETHVNVKSITKWSCSIDGHEHSTKDDAESCETLTQDLSTSLEKTIDLVKQFTHQKRSLTDVQTAQLRQALESIQAALPTKEEDEDDTSDDKASDAGVFKTVEQPVDEESFTIKMDESELTRLVTESVKGAVDRFTGRVD